MFSNDIDFCLVCFEGVVLSNGYLWKNQRKFAVTHLRNIGEGKKSFELSIQQENNFLCDAFKAEKGNKLRQILISIIVLI